MVDVARPLLRSLLVLAVILSTTAAGTAQASTVSRSGGLLFVIASHGERNMLSIDAVRGNGEARVEVRDGSSDLVAGTFCGPVDNVIDLPQPFEPEVAADPAAVSCDGEKLAAVVVLAGGRADVVRVELEGRIVAYIVAGPGDDAIYGSAPAHVLQGGSGADRIVVEENVGGVDIVEGGDGPDRIDVVAGAGRAIVRCGAGFDIVELDTADRPSDGCEGRSFPAPTALTDSEEAPQPAPAPEAPVPPRLPDPKVTATASASGSACALRPRRRNGALTVRLGPAAADRGDVSWVIYKNKARTRTLKTGSDPVDAGRRERLTSMRRKRPFDTWLTEPKPCP